MKLAATAMALAALAASTQTASAARPSCPGLTDPRGDASYSSYSTVNTVPAEDSLDLVSADAGSDATTLTAALRVADLSLQGGPAATGQLYVLNVVIGDTVVELSADRSPVDGDRFSVTTHPVGASVVTADHIRAADGWFDSVRKTVVVRVPRRTLDELEPDLDLRRPARLGVYTEASAGAAESHTFVLTDEGSGDVVVVSRDACRVSSLRRPH